MDSKNTNNKLLSENKLAKRRLRVGDPDFRPPDGGWGWLVVLACGFSNLSTFPMFQQFGLVFREKYEALGITNAETTTIINLNSAFNACVGLLNGPVFRKYSYRQVAFFGGTLVATSLFISTYCQSFWTYLIFYAIFYGSGIGITQSANSLALNTYFKNKRRIATGLSWSTTALGPIVWPYIITALTGEYGMEGTLLIFSAFAGHAIMCSLLLQPVHWHTEFRENIPSIELQLDKDAESGYFEERPSRARSLFSSQYLYNEDDPVHTGYEITDPGTPRMVGANDGWYSRNRSLAASRISLASNKTGAPNSKMASDQNSRAISRKASYTNVADAKSKRSSTYLNVDVKERKRKTSYNKSNKPKIEESVCEDCPLEKAPQDLKEEEKLLITQRPIELIVYPNEKEVLKTAAQKLEEYKQFTEIERESKMTSKNDDKEEEKEEKYSVWQKIVIFFDLDLLKDMVYLNIMLGITIANFAEINFSILTPFVLKEFNFEKYQIATFMSLLGATDILMRFFIPFIADKIGWSNRTFFLVGVLGMAFGRIILVHTQEFYTSLAVAIVIGFGKGLRTIFIALVIPSHVSLERLPAASGLYLATSGLLFLLLGPVVGWVRDGVNNYVITLHLLNIMTYITAFAWIAENVMKRKRNAEKTQESSDL